MAADGYALFATAIGTCGIAWSPAGIVALQLPEATEAATLARLKASCPDAVEVPPPDAVRAAIAGVVALLDGAPRDLRDVVLDLRGTPPFHRDVYALARTIPPGETLTYGEVARRLGDPDAARAVGQALGRNPVAIIVPCHRVVAAGGALGGFSAGGGAATKRRILAIEGASGHAPMLPGIV